MKRWILAAGGAVLLAPAAAQQHTPVPSSDTTRVAKNCAIGDVVVTGTRSETDLRHLPMTVTVVGHEAIEQALRPSLLPTLTEQVPGLFVTSRGVMGYGVSGGAAGGMSLRGVSGGAGRMMVLIDGHPQYMGLMGHPIADAYHTSMAERVEVLRGPASVLYGSNAMGGVVNIVTRKMAEDGVRTDLQAGYGSWNTLQSEVTNRVRAGRFTSVVSGTYDRTDGHRADMGFEQYGGYAKLGYEVARRWNLLGDVQVTRFNASNPGEVTAPLLDADQRVTRGMASLALTNDYAGTSGTLSLFYNWGDHWINDGHAADAAPLDYRYRSKDEMAGISWFQSAGLFRGNRTTFGVDYYHFGGRAWNDYVAGEQLGEEAQLADKQQDEVAGYVDFRQAFGSWLTLDAALRVDHHSHVGTEWVPQAGLSFHLPHAIELKASASKGFRFPTIREMYMFPPQNAELRPERMWNYELSFSQQAGPVRYGVNLFYIDGDNMIETVREGGRPQNINSGRIENAGVEAEASWRISAAWRVDANYSWLHMKYPVLAAPEHKLYAGAAFARRRWTVTTGVQYVAGLCTSLAEEVPTEHFVLWNLRASFRAAKWLDVWVRGENLLAQRYEINAGFPMPRATVLAGLKLNFRP